eukprot:TRINITY_DN64483_c0_g1_i1.p1 TRINITY_DN64483_c0_g1~~TRINITY_DN64483_c0_g1_i1.p1  ORF type:complete len:181 (-),score=59.34 TRINITY_DN64483_c0_g1_i1:6-548(-)
MCIRDRSTGVWFADVCLVLMSRHHEQEAVKVVVRCRPFIGRQLKAKESCAVRIDGDNVFLEHGDDEDKFLFDETFAMESDQQTVFERTAKPLVSYSLDGYNGTMFAYGQTGSGKTFTMDGSPENEGIMRRAFRELFAKMNEEMEFYQGNQSCLLYTSDAADEEDRWGFGVGLITYKEKTE